MRRTDAPALVARTAFGQPSDATDFEMPASDIPSRCRTTADRRQGRTGVAPTRFGWIRHTIGPVTPDTEPTPVPTPHGDDTTAAEPDRATGPTRDCGPHRQPPRTPDRDRDDRQRK